MQVFATSLRERAIKLGISNAEAARRSGLSERRYGHYVSGIREPDLATLLRIAQALGTTPNALLGVGVSPEITSRALLLERLSSATSILAEDVLAIVVIQTEALNQWQKSISSVRSQSDVKPSDKIPSNLRGET